MYRVLVVDDEKMVLVSVCHSFDWKSHHIHQVDSESNPYQAVEKIKANRYDAVFLDIRMPELSGLDILKLCKDAFVPSVFVILSGYSDFQYAQQALKLGAFDYCLKPLQPEETSDLLCRLTTRVRAGRYESDPLYFKQLLSEKDSSSLLTYLGLSLLRPYFTVFICIRKQESPETEFSFEGEQAVLFLSPEKACYFFTSEIPLRTENLIQTPLPELCGASFACVRSEYFQPQLIKRCLTDAEHNFSLSGCQHQAILSQLEANDMREWNHSFLLLVAEVESHFTFPLSLTQLAEKYHLNYSYCSQLFVQHTGMSFPKYLTYLRMNQAKDLLRQSPMSVSEISEKVGYSDYHYFANLFKKQFHQTPSQFRESMAQENKK